MRPASASANSRSRSIDCSSLERSRAFEVARTLKDRWLRLTAQRADVSRSSRHMFGRFGCLEEQIRELGALAGQAKDVFGGLRRHLGHVNFDVVWLNTLHFALRA